MENSSWKEYSFFLHFIFLMLFYFILFFNFTVLYWFCYISTWIRHRYTRVPHLEPSSLLPPCTIPLGHPSAPASSTQYRASNLDWWLVSYMISYMFQCHSPKSSHPLPLPQSPKDCSIWSVALNERKRVEARTDYITGEWLQCLWSGCGSPVFP